MYILDLFNYNKGKGTRLEKRVCGILMRNGITTVEDLRRTSDKELLLMRGMGQTSLEFIHKRLSEITLEEE